MVAKGETQVVTLGNKLSMLVQVLGALTIMATIVLAWGKIEGRIGLAEHRILQLEAKSDAALTRRESDNAALSTLTARVEALTVTQAIGNKTLERLDQRLIDIERAPTPRQ